MVSLRKPSAEAIRAFLEEQGKLDFSYEAVGATQGEAPAGYVVDHTRVVLGRGEEVYRRACKVLDRWGQFGLGWVEASAVEQVFEVGNLVAIVARQFGVWWLSACRVVYVVNEATPSVSRYGLAYGTLPDHAGSGEERFLVEWDHETGEVWYDVLAFSRPGWLVSRVFYPYLRRMQKRFGRESALLIQQAMAGEE
jgi:uncharacterized protein (UPF0548 family)